MFADALDAITSKFFVTRRLKDRKLDGSTDPFSDASHVAITSNRLLLLKRHGDAFSLVQSTRLADVTGIELLAASPADHHEVGRVKFSFRNGPSTEVAMPAAQAASLLDAWRVPSAMR